MPAFRPAPRWCCSSVASVDGACSTVEVHAAVLAASKGRQGRGDRRGETVSQGQHPRGSSGRGPQGTAVAARLRLGRARGGKGGVRCTAGARGAGRGGRQGGSGVRWFDLGRCGVRGSRVRGTREAGERQGERGWKQEGQGLLAGDVEVGMMVGREASMRIWEGDGGEGQARGLASGRPPPCSNLGQADSAGRWGGKCRGATCRWSTNAGGGRMRKRVQAGQREDRPHH